MPCYLPTFSEKPDPVRARYAVRYTVGQVVCGSDGRDRHGDH